MRRTAAPNEMKEDKMLESLLPLARPIYTTALTSYRGIWLSSIPLCFLTSLDTIVLKNKIRVLSYTPWPVPAFNMKNI